MIFFMRQFSRTFAPKVQGPCLAEMPSEIKNAPPLTVEWHKNRNGQGMILKTAVDR
jgi:hypothetical protein